MFLLIQHLYIEFQSTHLSRGATMSTMTEKELAIISIHTPLTRCDGQYIFYMHCVLVFQSTHLSRGATMSINNLLIKVKYFNPHTSHEVRPSYILWESALFSVHFNPHTSHEVRQIIVLLIIWLSNFNPHTSHEVRPKKSHYFLDALIFQSTHLSRGAT